MLHKNRQDFELELYHAEIQSEQKKIVNKIFYIKNKSGLHILVIGPSVMSKPTESGKAQYQYMEAIMLELQKKQIHMTGAKIQ